MTRRFPGYTASLFTAPFMVCVAILGMTAIGLPWATSYLRIVLTKEAIPLRRPLARLDKGRLGPYVFRSKIDLQEMVVEALGTDQYIYWLLEDTSYGEQSLDPRRFVHLAVTYYTGQPDPVPHTPDVCLTGAGYITEQKENRSIHLVRVSDPLEVPVRVLTAVKSGIFGSERMTVVYTFHCNGRFAETRQAVRMIVNDPRQRYAYYSKVEVTFGWQAARPPYPPREQAVAATTKLLSHVLPLLLEEHWPDWAGVKRIASGEVTP